MSRCLIANNRDQQGFSDMRKLPTISNAYNVTTKDVSKMRALKKKGMALADIGIETGFSMMTVSKYTKDIESVNHYRKFRNPEIVKKMLHMRVDGFTLQAIADKMGCSPMTVFHRTVSVGCIRRWNKTETVHRRTGERIPKRRRLAA